MYIFNLRESVHKVAMARANDMGIPQNICISRDVYYTVVLLLIQVNYCQTDNFVFKKNFYYVSIIYRVTSIHTMHLWSFMH